MTRIVRGPIQFYWISIQRMLSKNLGVIFQGSRPSTDWCQVCPEENVFNRYPLPAYEDQKRGHVLFNAAFMLRRKPVFDVGINYLESILYEQIDKRKNVRRVHSTNLIELTRTAQDLFCITLEQQNQRHKVFARYIIVADGAKSDTLSLIGARKKGTHKT